MSTRGSRSGESGRHASSRWRHYWRHLTRRFRPELEEEVAFHLDMRASQFEAEGLSPEAARREARRRFGDQARITAQLERIERKRGHRMAIAFWLEETAQDVRYGLRSLLKRPAFAVMTTSSLAVGIAAVTIVLGVVDSWLLRPLPVRNPGELVVIGVSTKAVGSMVARAVSIPTVRDLQRRTDLFQAAAATQLVPVGVRTSADALGERRLMMAVTGNYFTMLGVSAERGRTLVPDDETRRERVVVLTDRSWRHHFGANPAAIGSTIYVDGTPLTIVGITPRSFAGTDHMVEPDGFVPLTVVDTFDPSARGFLDRREPGTAVVIARPEPGMSLVRLQAALTELAGQIEQAYPEAGEGYRLVAIPESRARPSIEVSGITGRIELIFAGMALLVLLTACVNATNLLLADGSSRESEVIVRQALGASRRRVIRQLVTQNLLLALAALILAWGVASLAIHAISRVPLAVDLQVSWGFQLDLRIFAAAFGLSVLVGLLAGLGPAVATSRATLQSGIREGGRGAGGRGAQRLRSSLVVGQIAASLVVLVCAGFLWASVRQAGKIDLGFRPDDVLTLGLDPAQMNRSEGRARSILERARQETSALPGVLAAALSNAVPMGISNSVAGMVNVFPDGVAASSGRDGGLSMFTAAVTSSYFDAMQLPIIEGRAFEPRDDSAHVRVGIVNQQAAELLWPGKSAIGRLIRLTGDPAKVAIVGVAKNSKYAFIGESQRPFLYLAFPQERFSRAYLVVRSAHDPASLVPSIRRVIAAVDRDLIPFDAYALATLVRDGPNGLLPIRIGAMFAAGVGLVATFVTLMGLYGVIAYSVVRRTREIGIRMALGANRTAVVAMVLRQGGRLAAFGLVLGLIGAVLVTRGLAALLIGVRVTDLSIFAAVTGGLALAALASAFVPARRASRIDPTAAVRQEG